MEKNVAFYGITDGSSLEQVAAALRGGLTMLQLRKKNFEYDKLVRLCTQIKELTDAFDVPLIVNDFPEIAKRCDAAGVHLGAGDGDVREARAYLGKKSWIGATARTISRAVAAEYAGADYLGAGALFPTGTKNDAAPLSLHSFRELTEAVKIPVIAIGGITTDNIMTLKGYGMSGFAISSGIFCHKDTEKITRALRDQVDALL